ncbi:CBS domain-containing protein [Nocardia sp. BMG111209]|uniref:CBS domain-containing protein n=1 Tax=Nocardia sp. BMG111209 TaxID=1160137 RepID=UPI0004781CB6|nr:CBS domain-containing protein [Nocardia sp. BMG111209]
MPTIEHIYALKGRDLTVSKLLAFFGFRYRNFESVPTIDAALENAGLTTEPSFATCKLNMTVKVVDLNQATEDPVDEAEDPQLDSLPTRPFLVSDLPSATAGLTSITFADGLPYALHLMQTEGYSQIPVIDGTSSLKGIVTWRSVAAVFLRAGVAHTLSNAMEKAETVELHLDLFRELSRLCEHGYLLVRNNDGELTGIITPTDITNQFHDTALPFFLVGEIEFRLRACLRDRIGPDSIREVQRYKKTGDIDDLVFGDYLSLLRTDQQKVSLNASAEANWQNLGWHGVDRNMFIDHLIQVKNIRNSIAHFDAKPTSLEDITVLRKFSALLKALG